MRCTTHPRRPAGTWWSHRSHGHSSMGPRSHRLAPGSLVCSSLEEHQQQGGFANAVWMVLFQPSTGHPDPGSFEDLSSLTSYPLSKDSPFPQHLLWTTMYSFGFLHHIFCVYTTPSSSPLCHQVDVRLWSFNDCTEHKNEKRCLYQGYRVAFFYISNSIHYHRNWTLEPKYRERRLVNHKWEKVHQIKHVSQRGSGTILSLQLGLLDLQWKRSNGLHPCTFLCISEHCPSPSYPTPPPTPL